MEEPQHNPPKKARFQFSLRAIVITVVIAAIGFWFVKLMDLAHQKEDLSYWLRVNRPLRRSAFVIPADTPKKTFDSELWRVPWWPNENRIKMVDDLLASHLRQGMTKQEVRDLLGLGYGDTDARANESVYPLKQLEAKNRPYGCLCVEFDDNHTVVGSKLEVHYDNF